MTTHTPKRGRPPKPRIHDKRLADALAETSRVVREHQEAIDEFGAARDRLILRALANGWTYDQIAETTGLSRGRVGQVASRKV